MRTLSIVLIVLAGLAAMGLFYGWVVERQRDQIRERAKRDFERLRSSAQSHQNR